MAIPFLAQTIFKDNVKLVFGDGLDLQIYHDGSNSRIGDAGTGNLIISGTNLHLTDAATGEYFFRGTSNGAVQLYYDGTEKFITTSTGIDVTGTVNLDNLTINSAQGTDGQVLTSTGTGIAWEDIASETAERIEVTVKNVSGGSLSKGTVVHASPSATPPSGNVIEVIAADYDDSTKMPAIGILNETIADTAEGSAVMMGAVSGIDTSSFSIGDELYVGNLGTLTNTKPATSGQLIQKIAVVIKSHASNGLIKIFGAGRSNDVPLPLYIDNTNQRVGIGDSTPSYTLDVNGTIYGSAVRSGRYYGTSGTSSYLDLDSGAPYSLLASSEVNVTNSIICNDLEATEVGGIAASNGPVYGLRFYGYGNTTYYVDPNDSTTSAILNGKVGIGTTSPDKKLHISSTNAAITNPLSVGNALRFTDDDPTQNNGQITGTIEWETKDSNSAGVQSYITTVSTNTGLGNLAFGTGAGGSATERMRLDSSGNVSIGESSARNARLLLNNAGSQGAPQLMLIDSGDSGKQSEIRFDSGNLIFDYWGGSSRSERMRIGPAGQIGIGGANYGTSGQVLTSNGSGSAPSWQNAGAGSSNWTLSGNDIYNNNSGNVGIGTTTPSEKLDVSGTIQSSANEGKIIINSTATNGKEYQLISIDTGNLGLFDGTAYRLWVSGSGSVGIGTTSPSAKLHVAAASGDGLKIITSDVSTIKMGSTTGATSYWGFATTNLAASDFGIYQSNSTGGDPITAGTPRLYFSSIGNIGVGTSSPINGGGNAKWITIDATSANSYSGGIVYSIGGSGKAYHYVENDYLIHQGQSNVGHKFVTNGTTERLRIGSAGQIGIGGANYGTSGQVLTSNGSGSAPSWQNASGSSNWTLSGNDIYNNNSGNVGIGTSSPASKLHIQNSAGGSGGYLKITDVTYGGDVRFGMADGVNNDVILGSWTNNSILVYTNTAERARITNTGNVGINTTGPAEKLQVVGNIGAGDGTYNGGVYANSSSTAVDTNWGFDFLKTTGQNDYSTRLKYYPVTGESRKAGIWNSRNNTWVLYGDSNNTPNVIIPSGSLRAPIFYDSNDTAYYLDPNTTATSLNTAGGARIRNIDISPSSLTDTIQNKTSGGNLWLQYGHNGPVGLGYGGGLTTAYNGLHVYARGAGWDDGLNLYSNDVTNKWNLLVDNGAADHLRFAFNSSEKARLQTDGALISFGQFVNSSNGFKSLNNKGMVGDYDTNGTATKIIWTIGDSWNTTGNMYGLAYEYNGTYGHHLALKENGTTYQRLSFYSGSFFSGTVTSNTDFRAPIFYDSDNTGYYVNPAGGSQLSDIYYNAWLRNNRTSNSSGLYWETGTPGAGWHIYPLDQSDMYIRAGSGNGSLRFTTGNETARGYVHWTGSNEVGFLNSSRSWSLRVDNSGNTFATASHRAPIFYDSNDTTYYVNPASQSILSTAKFLGVVSNGSPTGDATIGRNHAYNTLELKGYGQEMMIGSQGTALHINYRTCNNGVSGHTPTSWYWRAGSSTSYSDHYMGLIQSSSSMRAPIFYDSNDTTFYADPAGTSIMQRIMDDHGNEMYTRKHSGSDFANGTLVQTDITSNTTNGASFVLEATGKSYSSDPPFGFMVQGYLYSNTIINHSGVHYGKPGFDTMKVFDYNGKLAFWWPRVSYWNSFDVYVRDAGGATHNLVTAIGNSTEPSSSKKVSVTMRASAIHGYNPGSTHASSLYATVLYDSNNTSYYVDPASTSVLDRIVVGDGSTSSGGTALRIEDTFTGNNAHRILEVKADQGSTYAYGVVGTRFYNVAYGAGAVEFYRSSSFGPDTNAVAFRTGSTTVGSISMTGSSTSYNTTSDYRLKENIIDLTDGTERVKQLKPRRFNFIEDPDNTVDGFIAHEADLIVPESVTGEKDEVYPTGEPVYQSMDNAKLVPVLTAALQEAITKIEDLETRIQILENQ